MKVLVTGAGALLGQGIINSLRRSTLAPKIVAVDPSPLSAGLYWTDSAHLVPMANRPEYGEAIARVLQQERPDAVLVGTDVELMYFAEHRSRIEAEFDTHVVVSSPEVIAIADDKFKTAEFLRANGFPYPDSVLPGQEQDLIARVGFPVLVKPRVGARSAGVSKVHNRDELVRAVAAVDGALIQEYLGDASHEFTAGVVYFDGQNPASIVMRRDLRDGNTYRAFTEPFPEYNAEVQRMAVTLRPYGPVNFQFRLHHGRVVVFEINGRFSGTTPLRALCGFNEVEMVLRHLCDGTPLPKPTVHNRVILRHWSETVVEQSQIDAIARAD